jgi:WD40 repeat protein
VVLSRQLVAESDDQLALNPRLAGQLAVTAWSVYPTTEAAATMSALVAQGEQAGAFATSARGLAVAFSANGHILAVADDDGTVRLLDPTNGMPLRPPVAADVSGANGMAFSPDSRLLAVTDGSTVRLCDTATGRLDSGDRRPGRHGPPVRPHSAS